MTGRERKAPKQAVDVLAVMLLLAATAALDAVVTRDLQQRLPSLWTAAALNSVGGLAAAALILLFSRIFHRRLQASAFWIVFVLVLSGSIGMLLGVFSVQIVTTSLGLRPPSPTRGLVTITGTAVAIASIAIAAYMLRRQFASRRGKLGALLAVTAAFCSVSGVVFGSQLYAIRSLERRVGCMANLRVIYTGFQLHANHHGGRFPVRLDEILPVLYPAPQEGGCPVLISPADRQPVPLEGTNVRSSYAYVGPIPLACPSGVIIAYSRRDVHKGGRTCLFLDGRVEWLTDAVLMGSARNPRSLRHSYEQLRRAVHGNVTPDREAELRSFYEVRDEPTSGGRKEPDQRRVPARAPTDASVPPASNGRGACGGGLRPELGWGRNVELGGSLAALQELPRPTQVDGAHCAVLTRPHAVGAA